MAQITQIRSLIDKHFSLQWCRDNVVIPLSKDVKASPEKSTHKIA